MAATLLGCGWRMGLLIGVIPVRLVALTGERAGMVLRR
jgi:hypothetical protein